MEVFQKADLSLLGQRTLQVQRLDKLVGNPLSRELVFPAAFTSSSTGLELLEREPSASARLSPSTSRLDPWTVSATDRSVPEQAEDFNVCEGCRKRLPNNQTWSDGCLLCGECSRRSEIDDTTSYQGSNLSSLRSTTTKMKLPSLNSGYEPGHNDSVRPTASDLRTRRLQSPLILDPESHRISEEMRSETSSLATEDENVPNIDPTRLYLGNVPWGTTKQEIAELFSTRTTESIEAIRLMNGFGFIDFANRGDAIDAVLCLHGSDFKGERLTVQLWGPQVIAGINSGRRSDRDISLLHGTIYRMLVAGLPPDTSWQDLRDFASDSGYLDVIHSEVDPRLGLDGSASGIVEYETASDLQTAVLRLDGRQLKAYKVWCLDTQELPHHRSSNPRSRSRSLSPNEYDRTHDGESSSTNTPDQNEEEASQSSISLKKVDALALLGHEGFSAQHHAAKPMYITYTISEDRSGSQDAVTSMRLAALGATLRKPHISNDFTSEGLPDPRLNAWNTFSLEPFRKVF